MFEKLLYIRVKRMSTFEIVKKRIERDMKAQKVHTQSSWARILTEHTSRLHSEEEQKKFWNWICNPYEDEIPAPNYENIPAAINQVSVPKTVIVSSNQDDEKTQDVQLNQEIHRNGLTCYIKVTPQNTV